MPKKVFKTIIIKYNQLTLLFSKSSPLYNYNQLYIYVNYKILILADPYLELRISYSVHFLLPEIDVAR